MASKWKFIIITEDLEVYGTDDRNEVMKFCRDADAAGGNNLVLENGDEGVFQLKYTAVESEEEGDAELENEVEEDLERVEIEAL